MSPLSAVQRTKLRLVMLAELTRFESALAKNIASILAIQSRQIGRALSKNETPGPHTIETGSFLMRSNLKSYYRKVMITFYEQTKKMNAKASDISVFMEKWAAQQSQKAVDQIDATTLKRIRTVVDESIQEGLTLDDVIHALEGTTAAMTLARALTIARTELHLAMNVAQLQAAKDVGNLVKIWTATLDDRTRDAHAEADGQTVPVDADFEVGGEMIPSPGFGSISNSINCRCVMIFAAQDK